MRTNESGAELGYEGDYEVHPANGRPQESPLTILRRLLRGRLRVAFGIGAVLGCSLAAAGYLLPKPQYRSFGVLEVVSSQPKILFNLEEKNVQPMFDSLVDKHTSLVSDPRVVSQVMRSDAWRSFGRGISSEEIARFQESLSAARIKRTPLIEVSFLDEDPAAAQCAANEVIGAYLQIAEEREQGSAKHRLDKLEQERTGLRRKQQDLDEQERARSDGHGARWIESQYQRGLDDLAGLRRRITDKQLEIDSLANALPVQKTERVAAADLTVERLAASNELMAALVRARSAAETELRVLQEEYKLGGRDPRVIAAHAKLDNTNQEIQRVLKAAQQQAAIDAAKPIEQSAEALEVEQKRAELARLREAQRQQEADLEPLAKLSSSLEAITRDQADVMAELDQVKERIRELEVEFGDGSDIEKSPGRVMRVHEAERPGTPYRDRRIPYAVLGGLGGLGMGFLLVALYGLARGQMRHVEDVIGNESQGRFLAIVPDIGSKVGDAGNGTSLEMTEYCVHHLRTLLQLGSQSEARSIALTSPMAGAGKTTVGVALALSFGATGSRTLLVDCDLVGHGLTSTVPTIVCEGVRAALETCADGGSDAASYREAETHVRRAFASRDIRVTDDEIEELLGRVHEASATAGSSRAQGAFRALETMARYKGVNGFAPGRKMGVLDVLGGAALEECVLETGFANLSVLPIGDARSTDAERLSPTHVARLIRLCHEQYDTVIFDTGPVLGSLEASFVAAVAEEVVFVVARGEPRRPADEALKRLDRLGARVSGIVFNRADLGDVIRSSYTSRSESVAAGSE